MMIQLMDFICIRQIRQNPFSESGVLRFQNPVSNRDSKPGYFCTNKFKLGHFCTNRILENSRITRKTTGTDFQKFLPDSDINDSLSVIVLWSSQTSHRFEKVVLNRFSRFTDPQNFELGEMQAGGPPKPVNAGMSNILMLARARLSERNFTDSSAARLNHQCSVSPLSPAGSRGHASAPSFMASRSVTAQLVVVNINDIEYSSFCSFLTPIENRAWQGSKGAGRRQYVRRLF